MPTARELLEQADALMRRNRKRGKSRLGDVPTLTAALGVDDDATPAPTVMLPGRDAADPIALPAPDEANGATPDAIADVDAMSLDALGDVPVLTDEVLDWPPRTPAPEASAGPDRGFGDVTRDAFPVSAVEAEAAAAEFPRAPALEQEIGEVPLARVDSNARSSASPPMAPMFEDEFILEIPPAEEEPAAAATVHEAMDPIALPEPAVPATLSPGGADWNALAEEIRMQVLQRLDLFTDTGMRDQLGARLRPIVERAGTELIATINRQLGELVRGYVAEAIEREIESWHKRNG